jgi:FkbM family methyltransferase
VPVGDRLKQPARRALRRAGFTLFSERPPRDLIAPLPVEDAAQRLLLRALLERLGVSCVIDVGAHLGEYGARLRDAGYDGELVSLEPVAASFEAVSRRAAGDPRWRVHRLALGSEERTAAIGVAREANFSSFLQPSRFSLDWYGGGSAVARTEEVPVRRLDAVFAELTAHVPGPPRDLLKTDTQGYDLEVLAGAEGVLGHVVALHCELSVRAIYEGAPDWLDALRELRSRGFSAVHLGTVNRDAALGIVELDCLLARSGPAT